MPGDLYPMSMSPAVTHLLQEAAKLSAPERAELADRMVERLALDIPPDMEQAQLAVVRRRMRQVAEGSVTLIPGEEALARVRSLLVSSPPAQ